MMCQIQNAIWGWPAFNWEEERLQIIEEQLRELNREKQEILARQRSRINPYPCPYPYPPNPPAILPPILPDPPMVNIQEILKKIPKK